VVKGRFLAVYKARAAKFKQDAVRAGVNEPRKLPWRGPRKGRAEVAAYADCPENRMMAVSTCRG
jgi:hypothetical protein